jgi:glycine/D-amino acid oxidase-like deaminating enzyme
MRVLICGGGVIGASIAYFLARRGIAVTVVERAGIACAASGKAGGFLALDWNDRSPVEELARRSFALHAQLAEEVSGDWGYRRLTTYGGFSGFATRERNDSDLGWLSPEVTVSRPLGSPETTAQVHPALFTAAMMRAAEAHGAELRIGTVTGLLRNGDAAAGAVVDGETIEADAVVIAMGPWSILAAQWLPLPPVFGLKGHSLVFDTGSAVAPEALFLECRERGGAVQTPEIFPRPDGTTYVCAISSEAPLPLDPAGVAPDPGAIERLHAICRGLSPALAGAKVAAAQACYRPVARDGLPLIGAVPGAPGAYVATGHSVWGILNAPATGEAMAELIVDGRSALDLTPFNPGRMRPLDPKRLQMG